MDVLLVPARLSGLKSVMSNVEAIIAAVKHIRVIKDAVVFECDKNVVDKFINGLQRAQALSVVVVVVLDVFLGLLREVKEPVCAGGLTANQVNDKPTI